MNKFLTTSLAVFLVISCETFHQDRIAQWGPVLQSSFIWNNTTKTSFPGPRSVGFRKVIVLKEKPAHARIMIFADSRYILWVNGNYVERGPCRFDPKGPQYDSIDLNGRLYKGLNTIAVMVQGGVTGSLKIMKHRPGLAAVLLTDDQHYSTDSNWRCSDRIPEQMMVGRWTWSCILDSVNADVPDYGWQAKDFNDQHWDHAVAIDGNNWGPLTPRSIPLLRETNLGSGTILQVEKGRITDTTRIKLSGKLPLEFKTGDEIVIDASRLSLAYWHISFHAPKDSRLVFTPCQDFVNGKTIVSYNCVTTYRTREGFQEYRTGDTFGFRYLNLKVASGSIRIDSLEFISRQYPAVPIARFTCSDDFLNRAWKQTSYTAAVLCEDGYVDSAERAEWMGDVGMIQYPVSRMVIAGPGDGKDSILYSDPRLLRNILVHIAQSQEPDGRLKAHHPSDRFDLHSYIEDYSCFWVESLRQYYDNTGDPGLVKELWPAMEKQMQWFIHHKNASGLYTAREFLIHLDNPLRYQVCQGATVNAFIYKAFNDASYLAGETGRGNEKKEYGDKAAGLKEAYNKLLWDERSGGYYSAVYYPEFQGNKLPVLKLISIQDPASEKKEWSDGNVQWIRENQKTPPTVQAVLTALDQGIVSEEHEAYARAYLVKHSGELKNPYTHRMLFDEFYKYDRDSLDREVLDIIRKRWKNMVDRLSPGTSAEGFETQGYLCHPFGLVPAYILPAYVLGVRKPEPLKNKTILIEPRLGDLTFAEGTGMTELGPVHLQWKKVTGKLLEFRITIPANCTAILRLPRQGKMNRVIINGKPADCIPDGRFLQTRLPPGTCAGSVQGL